MSFGLEIFGADGVKTLEVSDRLTRFHATISGALAYHSDLNADEGISLWRALINVAGVAADGSWFVCPPTPYAGGVAIDNTGVWFNIYPGQIEFYVVVYGSPSGAKTLEADLMRA